MMLPSLGTVPTGIFCSCLAAIAIAITVLQATRFVLELARTQGFTAGPLLLGVRNFIYFTEAFI